MFGYDGRLNVIPPNELLDGREAEVKAAWLFWSFDANRPLEDGSWDAVPEL